VAKKQKMTVLSLPRTQNLGRRQLYNSKLSFVTVAYDVNLSVNLHSGRCSPEPLLISTGNGKVNSQGSFSITSLISPNLV
jgi:hypothetical protein